MSRIDGKVVWITGASSGIGEALTYTLEKRQCKLIISSRKIAELKRVKANCQNQANIKIVALDLADFEAMNIPAKAAIEAFGKIDILINNAGLSQRSKILNTNIAVYKKLIDINYLGTVALTKALLPHFIQNKSGQFVTVSSLMGKFGGPHRSGYCGAKHALHGFFDVLRMEHERDGINVTMICPGYVQTNVDKNALTADGTPQKKHDVENQNGLEVNVFVRKMIRAIEKKKYEAYMGGFEVTGIYLKRFFPKLLHRIVLKTTNV